MESFFVALPLFLIIIAGWVFKKFRIVDETWIHVLNSFAYYVSLPALIIVSFWGINFNDLAVLSLAWRGLVVFAIACAVMFLVGFLFWRNRRRALSIVLVALTGNTVYMAFPLIARGLGEEYMGPGALLAVIFLIFPILLSIALIGFFIQHEHSIRSRVVSFIVNPLTISAVIGVVASFIPVTSSAVGSLRSALVMAGATASPIALFALGGFLYNRFLKRDVALVIFSSFLKVIILPIIILIAGAFLLPVEGHQLAFLLSVMPVAVTTFIIAERFKLDTALVGNTLLVSTVFSFVIIPLVFYLI